jgi:N-acetylglucosamine kinase-like BadF-type ATPase
MDDKRSTELLLGVDGGQRSTQAVLATPDGQVLGRGLGPPSDHHRVGLEAACRAIQTAIEGALAQRMGARGWGDARIGAACFGLADVDTANDEALFASWLRSQGCAFKYRIVNDAELILGATAEGWGVAVMSGTDSVCVGRSADGRSHRVGGWGHVFGDEGSAHSIAVEALKLATQAADDLGGSPRLLEAALVHWNVKEARDLVSALYRSNNVAEDLAAYGSRVLDLASRQDASAGAIADRAGVALARQLDAVIQKLAMEKPPPVALGGPLMRPVLKKAILQHARSPLGTVTVVADPVQGAVATARRLLQAAA